MSAPFDQQRAELRLECLKQAVASCRDSADDPLRLARELWAFVAEQADGDDA